MQLYLHHPIIKLLVSINQSSYLIYFCYNFFDRDKETNIYEIKSRRLRFQILTCFIFLVLFSKKITIFIAEECGKLIVVNDGEELTRNINQKRKSDIVQ